MSNIYTINEETLTDIADAIREKDGTTDPIETTAMGERVRAISGGASDELRVVITQTYNDETGGFEYTSDKTYAEILEARNNHKIVTGYLVCDGPYTGEDDNGETGTEWTVSNFDMVRYFIISQLGAWHIRFYADAMNTSICMYSTGEISEYQEP